MPFDKIAPILVIVFYPVFVYLIYTVLDVVHFRDGDRKYNSLCRLAKWWIDWRDEQEDKEE